MGGYALPLSRPVLLLVLRNPPEYLWNRYLRELIPEISKYQEALLGSYKEDICPSVPDSFMSEAVEASLVRNYGDLSPCTPKSVAKILVL